MADTAPLALPRSTVVPIATAAVHRARTLAIGVGMLAALCLIAGLADVVASKSPPDRDDSAAILCVGIFGVLTVFAARRAKRVARTAERAAADPGATWTLVGNLIVAADDRGVPVPDHSFKVTGAQRRMLLSNPAG